MVQVSPSGQVSPVEFGAYVLHGKVAIGGMAAVFLARKRDPEDERWYAIKRLHAHLAEREDVRKMFLNECHILQKLNHPNICGIVDFGIESEAPFLVMRYLHGAPLSRIIKAHLEQKKSLPVDAMAYVSACVCDGLHYAHEVRGDQGPLGLVHRDVSPQNLFVTFAGEVKLLDFGVAKAAGYEGLTKTGHVKGKYAYMSPEHITGQELDRRSDVFGLGICLWESLVGRNLFRRKGDLETIEAVKGAVVPSTIHYNAGVPRSLDEIVHRALARNPNERYGTAHDMGSALWSYLTTTQLPMGSDEMSELMVELFPNLKSPSDLLNQEKTGESQAQKVPTEPDGLAADSTPVALQVLSLDNRATEWAEIPNIVGQQEEEKDNLDAPTLAVQVAPDAGGNSTELTEARGIDTHDDSSEQPLIPWGDPAKDDVDARTVPGRPRRPSHDLNKRPEMFTSRSVFDAEPVMIAPDDQGDTVVPPGEDDDPLDELDDETGPDGFDVPTESPTHAPREAPTHASPESPTGPAMIPSKAISENSLDMLTAQVLELDTDDGGLSANRQELGDLLSPVEADQAAAEAVDRATSTVAKRDVEEAQQSSRAWLFLLVAVLMAGAAVYFVITG